MTMCAILIGVPCSGKSTWVQNLLKVNPKTDKHYAVVSSDDIIMELADKNGIRTYTEAFPLFIDLAETMFKQRLCDAAQEGKNIIVDRTNLTVKSRQRVINLIKANNSDYTFKAIVFGKHLNIYEWAARVKGRGKDKYIPEHILLNQAASIQLPSLEEGFNSIIVES